ncbi:MAG: DUF3160 domain-containing protein, partial [candidate division WS1 bacterium]|nr:DUF3160 domain-containing protein [candidate division WS1 bacterium]
MRQLSGLILVLMLATAVMMGGCRAVATDASPSAPDSVELTQGPQQYQFPPELSFGGELGAPPEIRAQVQPYTLASDLSNVTNLSLFKDNLRPEHLRQIAKQGFVVVPADWKQMEFVYELNNYPEEHRPSFVTTDSMLHTFHIFYDYLLRTIEVTTLYDKLTALAQGLLQETADQYREAEEPELQEAARLNFAYALVPVRLLGLSPGSEVGAIPAEVEALAGKELALIEAHEDMDTSGPSPTAGFKVDYSQFIPRGHYTRSEKLKKYFLAMMWYGLVPVALRNMRDELAPRQARQAVLLAHAILYGKLGEEPLGKLWQEIYEPTAFLVGFADDNTPADYGKAMYKLFGEPVDTRKLIPEENLTQLAEQVLALRKPGIVMASVGENTGGEPDPEKPGIPQFRLMGQRFILDSYLFQNMVFPHVGAGQDAPNVEVGSFNKRTFPMGLDVMSILGSERAYEIADQVYQQTRFKNYATQTQKLREEVSAYTEKNWTSNIYNGWLHTLKLLLEVKREGYPQFMQGQAWTDKQLNTALGSWAELRHDTILYAKQSVVAECGGGPE